jgi:hypothetical protein
MHCMRRLPDLPWPRDIGRFGCSASSLAELAFFYMPADIRIMSKAWVVLAPFSAPMEPSTRSLQRAELHPNAHHVSRPPSSREGMPAWLRERLIGRLVGPRIHLANGRAHRFGQGHRRLGGSLPIDRVEVEDAGHDWTVRLTLRHCALEAVPFEISSVGDV